MEVIKSEDIFKVQENYNIRENADTEKVIMTENIKEDILNKKVL